tara:strand:+ start:675 stop:1385 length:711 start_codon:yes stop_codon:yes gene_type:complete
MKQSAAVAQLGERGTEDPEVAGSIPAGGTNLICHMTIENYYSARNSAVKTMAIGLVFLLFLPIGIPLSLIIIPFLAGRSGAKKLPKYWHTTFIITVGGGCSLGLVFILYLILSLSLGPALKIGITEPVMLGAVVVLIWGSFFIGVRNSIGAKSETQINEEEWEQEEKVNKAKENVPEKSGIAITEEVKPKEVKKERTKKKELKPKKDVKDKLADLKSEFKKTKKRSAKLGALGKKR